MSDPGPWALGAGLEGRGVVVTGAARGIGRATAQVLAASGANIFGVDLDARGLEETVSALSGPGVHYAKPFDLRDSGELEDLLSEARRVLGRFDVLANVAAVLRRQPLDAVTVADWDLQHDVNLKAAFFLGRAAGEIMKEQGDGGRIINFTTAAWLTGPISGSDAYAASKGGIIPLTRGFARAFGPYGITANVVCPGQIDTPMQHDDNPVEIVRAQTAGCPLGRMGQPEEVAAVVTFLASRHASYVSGATVTVSGGSTMW